MARLIQTQPLTIGPVERAGFLGAHLRRAEERFEGHILRLRLHPHPVQKVRKRKADPGHDHRPGLDTAETVDAFLKRYALEDVVQPVIPRPVDQPVDLDAPGIGGQRTGIFRRVALAKAELVEIVIAGDVFQIGRRVGRGVVRPGVGQLCRRGSGDGKPRRPGDQRAAVHEDRFRRDIGPLEVRAVASHASFPLVSPIKVHGRDRQGE